MTSNRNIAEIGRKTGVSEQNMQHFISQSPWSGRAVIEDMQREIARRPELKGGVLILDESADAKSGETSAGAGRQHNGRLGKVDQCQVGVFLTYAKDGIWTWVDGELFLPEKWLSEAYAARRKKVGIPADRRFQTKIELGWQMIERVQAMSLPFEAVAFDTLYGRNTGLRDQCRANGIEYYADVPCNQPVYLREPEIVYPLTKRNHPRKWWDKRQSPCNRWPMTRKRIGKRWCCGHPNAGCYRRTLLGKSSGRSTKMEHRGVKPY